MATAVLRRPADVPRKQPMGHVGLYQLANQVRHKSIKQGFNFTLMVVGESGLGKSTFINSLFEVPINEPKQPKFQLPRTSTVSIESRTAEIREHNVRLRLTVIDTPGFGDSVDNTNCWKPVLEEIESRLSSRFEHENQQVRNDLRDERIHACLYFIQPTGHSLKQIDIEVMQHLYKRVNLIPVIAKSDTMEYEEIQTFKARILTDLDSHGIDIFRPNISSNEFDDEAIFEAETITECIPFAVVGSHKQGPNASSRVRVYPWGVVDLDNEAHCDNLKLRQLLIRNYMEELREHTQNLYETWRTEHMLERGYSQNDEVFQEYDPKAKEEAERAALQLKLTKMEADMQLVFMKKVREQEERLKRSEEELYARHREMHEVQNSQIRALQERKRILENDSGSQVGRKKTGFFRN